MAGIASGRVGAKAKNEQSASGGVGANVEIERDE